MNIQSLSKDLGQKYIKDIESSVGKVGPYYFIVEPVNQVALFRVRFSVSGAESVIDELKELMSHHRAIGRDGIRTANNNLLLECKINGLENAEEFAKILEEIATVLNTHKVIQVDEDGRLADNLGIFRIGTKLEIRNDVSVEEISETVGKRFKDNNQSRLRGFGFAMGWFLLLIPVYIIVRIFEPSILGFAFFSFAVLLAIFRKSLKEFYNKWTPTKSDLIILLLAYLLGLVASDFFAYYFSQFGFIISPLMFKFLSVLWSELLKSNLITLAFVLAFNYHVVRSLWDGATGGAKPVKRSIHRVL